MSLLTHALNYRSARDKLTGDANLFHSHVVNCWNKLPHSVVMAISTPHFKACFFQVH